MRIKRLADGTEEVDIKLMDDGRALIHLLIECDDGPIVIQGHAQLRAVAGRPAQGKYRVACRPKQRTVESQKRGSVRFMCMTTLEASAATCPACLATAEAKASLEPREPDPRAAQAAMAAIMSVKADQAAASTAGMLAGAK